VTPSRQNGDQTQWKGLRIKSDISVNMDAFNRIFVKQFPKVALDYDVDLSRYCPKRFILIYIVLKPILIVFKIHIFLCWTEIYRLFRFTCSNNSLS
jgi:hypothetical protein